MKKIVIVLYGLWILLSLGLKIIAGVSWWVATSWVWLPLGVILTIVLFVFLSVDLGGYLKAKQDSKIPDACENCLHHQMREFSDDGKCLGEALGEHKENEICSLYRRRNS